MNDLALWILGVIFYLQIGYWFGAWGWRVWRNRESPAWQCYILFPFSASENKVGDSDIPIKSFKDEVTYRGVMSLIWPLKVLWNVLLLFVTVLVVAIPDLFVRLAGLIGRTMGRLMQLPSSIVSAVGRSFSRRRSAGAPTSAVVPATPPVINPAARIDELSGKIAELTAEKEDLERRPDAQRL